MIKAHMNDEKGVPWWVAIAAPAVGVPLMVALLALASPQENAPAGEREIGVRTEQVEAKIVHPTEFEAEYIELHRQS